MQGGNRKTSRYVARPATWRTNTYMLRKIISLVALCALCAIAESGVRATSIESDPTKRKGAGAPFQIRRGKKWGYMNKAGKIIIEPQFDREGDFFHGLARVQEGDKWGYINEKGQEAIAFQFDDARDFVGEIAPVRVGRKWGYINLVGSWVVSPQFQAAGETFEGYARVLFWNRLRCGTSDFYTNENAPLYAYVLPDITTALTSGCFPADSKYGVLDISGRFKIKPDLDRIEDFSEGLAAFTDGNKVGYVDLNGTVVIAPKFEAGEKFCEGLAQARLNGKWGYIDKLGRWAIEPHFDYGGAFSEGLARVLPSVGKGMGYIDKTGKMVIKPEYEEAWDFSEGVAAVWKNQQWSYINQAGKVVLRTTKARWEFSDGLTIVGDYPNRVYIDKVGKVVAQYEVGSEF